MMGVNQTPMAHGERIQPLENYGVKLMSMGFLNPATSRWCGAVRCCIR